MLAVTILIVLAVGGLLFMVSWQTEQEYRRIEREIKDIEERSAQRWDELIKTVALLSSDEDDWEDVDIEVIKRSEDDIKNGHVHDVRKVLEEEGDPTTASPRCKHDMPAIMCDECFEEETA